MLRVCHVSAIVLKWFSLFVRASQTNPCKTVECLIFLQQSLHRSMMALQFVDFYHWMVKMKILPVHILLFKTNCYHSEGGDCFPESNQCMSWIIEVLCESCLFCMCYLTWCCSSRKHVISLLNLTNPLSDCKMQSETLHAAWFHLLQAAKNKILGFFFIYILENTMKLPLKHTLAFKAPHLL